MHEGLLGIRKANTRDEKTFGALGSGAQRVFAFVVSIAA
jgi:hypothetical protein